MVRRKNLMSLSRCSRVVVVVGEKMEKCQLSDILRPLWLLEPPERSGGGKLIQSVLVTCGQLSDVQQEENSPTDLGYLF